MALIGTGVGALVREGTPMLKVVHDGSASNARAAADGAESLLDEIVRDGARQMLAAALHAEVAAEVGDHHAERWHRGTTLSVDD